MSLTATLNIAQSALATNGALSTLVSRNIAGVNDPSYTRKVANVMTLGDGTGALVSVSRASDTALLGTLLSSTSDAASSSALSSGLDQLEQTVSVSTTSTGSTSTSTVGTSPATLIGALDDALQQYAASPGDTASGQAVISAAKNLATGLNAASATVQKVRTQADQGIASAVADVNSLLGQFKTVNDSIVKGTISGSDVTDLQDQRDKLLVSLSGDLGISTTTGANGSMSIYTDSGVTLFQDTPRTVSYTQTATLTAGTTGNPVTVDGVPVTGASAVMTLRSGSIAGLSQLRDTAAVSYQDQLDQIAGGLVSAFAESDTTGGTAPTIPGLFTYSGSPALPAAGQSGIAASLAVSSNVDPSQGGKLTRLRDGGIGDPGNSAYVANTSGAASYGAHIQALLGTLDGSRTFDASSGGAAQGTLAQYATSSVSWLEAARQSASDTSSAKSALSTQASSALNGKTGVNLDEQLSLMLDLEHSYQSSAQLMSTVNGMFTALFTAMQ